MEKEIHPFLIKESQVRNFYEFLLSNNYNVKIFDKKKECKIYELYLPQIRNYLFWTYNLIGNKKSFSELSENLKASVCKRYSCNIFEKKETIVICFDNGIGFVITDNKNEANKIINTDVKIELNNINLRDNQSYDIPIEIKNEEKKEYIYLYILQLYKMIFMHKTLKEIQISSRFNKVRTEFVQFVEQIYYTRATDNIEAVELCGKWEEALELEKLQLKIDNEFDLIYKNNKLNDNIKVKRLFILLFAIAIIIGIINLWGMMK